MKTKYESWNRLKECWFVRCRGDGVYWYTYDDGKTWVDGAGGPITNGYFKMTEIRTPQERVLKERGV